MLTNKELLGGLDSFKYELLMLKATNEKLLKNNFSSKIEKNAVLESWVIHFRCLLTFFNKSTTRFKDEILATHYLEKKEYEDITNLLNKWKDKEKWKDKADKQ